MAMPQDPQASTSQPPNLCFILHSANNISFESRPTPTITSPHDVLVRPSWTGICGSDIHYWLDGRIGPYVLEKPMVLGHETSGIVHEVGSGVTTLKKGDRVALEPGIPCRRCVACKSGKYNLCAGIEFASTPPHDGTLCRVYKLDADFCYKLPEHVSLEEGAVVEPTAVAVHIVRQGAVGPGSRVVVFGAGPVGLLCAAVARAFGAREVVLVDINKERLRFAEGWLHGVRTFAVEQGKTTEENAAAIKKGGGKAGWDDGADVVIDASGAASSVETGILVLRRGGTYVQGGMGRDKIEFPIMAVCTNEITVKGSFRYGSGDYDIAVGLIGDRKIDVKSLITGKSDFEDAERAFEETKAGKGIKMLIRGVQD